MDILDNIPEAQLRAFVAEYAQRDGDFANALGVRFAAPDFSTEVQKISRTIARKVKSASHYGRGGSWGYMTLDLGKVDEEIRRRLEQGQVRLAFAQAAAAYTELLPAYEIQEECEIADEAEGYIEWMAAIAKAAKDPADQEYMYRRCIELALDHTASDYGGDYQDRFLQIAVRFITPENREDFDAVIAECGNAWSEGIFAAIQLEALRKLEGKEAADAFMEEHLHLDEIRKIAYDGAMDAGAYGQAARLCAEAPPVVHRRVANWKELLFEAYQRAGDLGNMAQTAEGLLLSGKMDYYDKLKSIAGQLGQWDGLYPALLEKCRQQLDVSKYMQLLSQENELERLLGCVQANPSSIFTYGAQLAPQYGDTVEALFLAQIEADAMAARNRGEYAVVCKRIGLFRDAGFTARAHLLIEAYITKFGKKRAFVDELKQIQPKGVRS
jgi:hypothetical protein